MIDGLIKTASLILAVLILWIIAREIKRHIISFDMREACMDCLSRFKKDPGNNCMDCKDCRVRDLSNE